MLQIAIGVPLMMAAGILSDRVGQRKSFVVAGTVMIAAGLGLLTGFSIWPVVMTASILIGAGFWIYYSLGLAMITQLLPSASDRGKDLGVMNVAATLPQILIPPVGAAVINTLGAGNPGGYKILFLLGAGCVIMAVLLLRSIRSHPAG
jgi:MFS family permease